VEETVSHWGALRLAKWRYLPSNRTWPCGLEKNNKKSKK
jgi:hypothetical protein